MSDVAARFSDIRRRVDAACIQHGRPPTSVRLLAVSKTHSAQAIAEAVRAGARCLGENRAQELRDKQPQVAALIGPGTPAPEWHFIGQLQRNKVRIVAPRVSMLHSLDGLPLAEALSERVQRDVERGVRTAPLHVLIEVNTGLEASKGGVPAEATLDLAAQAHALPGLHVAGLMTIPPWGRAPEQSAPYFEIVAALAAEGRGRGLPLHELSMGMSGDFEVAVAHGSTIVRVGSAIFGYRTV